MKRVNPRLHVLTPDEHEARRRMESPRLRAHRLLRQARENAERRAFAALIETPGMERDDVASDVETLHEAMRCIDARCIAACDWIDDHMATEPGTSIAQEQEQ